MTDKARLNLAAILRQIADDVEAGWVGDVSVEEYPDIPPGDSGRLARVQGLPAKSMHVTVRATYGLRGSAADDEV